MGTLGPSTREQIRARHGDACWLCSGKLSFADNANPKRKPTIEHLQPRSLGGGNDLDNLVFCHAGCNQQLGNRPRSEKEAIRAKRKPPIRASKVVPVPALHVVPKPHPAPARTSAAASLERARVKPANWQHLAFLATAAASFFAGLSLGMLIG